MTLVSLVACTTWEPYVVQRDVEPPRVVRLHLTSGESVNLRSPLMEGDSVLFGQLGTGTRAVMQTIPLRSVESMEQRRFSVSTTIGLAVGLVAGFYAFVLVGVWARCSDGC
ncbi:MAG TPA: hypothetical protein VK858_12760 [Longimicrobiales bacterium]|nr:hypothetical protein [Longimicrobiales bacterium]